MKPSRVCESFVHPALFYRGAGDYVAGIVPFLQEGLAEGEAVLVAVPGDNLELLRDALGAEADAITMRDMTVAGRNPGRILPGVLLPFAETHRGKRVRIVGEPIWPSRTGEEYPACAQHEALINPAFTGREATILCPYDADRLAPGWLHDARRTHPVLRTVSRHWDSPQYRDPLAAAADFNQPLPDPPEDAATVAVTGDALAAIRRFVTDHGSAAGLPARRVGELTLAVNELASNSVVHGGGQGRLAIWTGHGHLICQLRDSGHITDPLAGRIPTPPDHVVGGRGLLIVNQLCDLVRVHSGPDGTTVRIHVRL